MISSFKCQETEKLFHGRFSRKLPQDIQRLAARKLEQLHAATVLDTLRIPPENRLEALSGDYAPRTLRIAKNNTVFVLIPNGESVLFGVTLTLLMLKLLIIIKIHQS